MFVEKDISGMETNVLIAMMIFSDVLIVQDSLERSVVSAMLP